MNTTQTSFYDSKYKSTKYFYFKKKFYKKFGAVLISFLESIGYISIRKYTPDSVIRQYIWFLWFNQSTIFIIQQVKVDQASSHILF